MARYNINTYNLQIDRTKTKRVLGRQGILYEFEFYKGSNMNNWWEEAANVKSIKRSEQYDNGKRPGQYQPIGDRRYFTYYQVRKMDDDSKQRFAEEYADKKMEKEFLAALERSLGDVYE